MWGLSPKTIWEIYQKGLDNSPGDSPEALMGEASQATLRHVYEEGEKDCTYDEDYPDGLVPLTPRHRFDCPRCRKELREEIR
mgnify:CR=1 FL=1